jgi:hypothetical protein
MNTLLHQTQLLSSYNVNIAANTPTTPARDAPTRMVSAAPLEVLDGDALDVEVETAVKVTN